MASRIQAKSAAGGNPAPDVPGGLPADALTESWTVGTGAAGGPCGDPGAGTLFIAAGSNGYAGAGASGGFATVGEAGRAGGSGGGGVPGAMAGSSWGGKA